MPVDINFANFSSNLIYVIGISEEMITVTKYRVQSIPMSVFIIITQRY